MAFLLEIARLFIYLVIYYFFLEKNGSPSNKRLKLVLNNHVEHLCYTILSLDTDGKDVWIRPQKTELCFLLLLRKGQ